MAKCVLGEVADVIISGVDIRRLAAAFDILFKKSLHVWTEPETDEPGHKRHPDVLWYHQYVCRFVCDMGEYFVRFAVKECRGQGGNAVHSSTITAVSMYKAQGARATDPGKDQGEANAPFVDNEVIIILFRCQWGRAVRPQMVGFHRWH